MCISEDTSSVVGDLFISSLIRVSQILYLSSWSASIFRSYTGQGCCSQEVKHGSFAMSAFDPNTGEEKNSTEFLGVLNSFLISRCSHVGFSGSYCMHINPTSFSSLSQPVFLPLFQEVLSLKDHIKLVHCVSCTSCFIGG